MTSRTESEESDEVEAALAGDDPASVDRFRGLFLVSENRKVDPREVRAEPSAQMTFATSRTRPSCWRSPSCAHNSEVPLDAGGDDVFRLDPDERGAMRKKLRS